MTRDEAIKIAHEYWGGSADGARAIDAWVRLGMLKLDEPKSARDRAEEAVRAKYIEKVASDLFDIIDAVGCKIVEK